MKAIIHVEHSNPLLFYLILTMPMGTLIVQVLSACASAFIVLNQFYLAKHEVVTYHGGSWKAYFMWLYKNNVKQIKKK